MNDKECFLKIKISYSNQNFVIQNKNFISLKQIKEESIKKFKLQNYEKLLQFSLKDNEKIIISSDDDIIKYLNVSEPLKAKLKLNLSIINENDNINCIKKSNINKNHFQRNYKHKSSYITIKKKNYGKLISQINMLKEEIRKNKQFYEEQLKNGKRNDILQNLYEKTYNTDFKKYNNIQDEVEDYFKYKYERPVSQMTIDNLPREMSYEIFIIMKLKVKDYINGEMGGFIWEYGRIIK